MHTVLPQTSVLVFQDGPLQAFGRSPAKSSGSREAKFKLVSQYQTPSVSKANPAIETAITSLSILSYLTLSYLSYLIDLRIYLSTYLPIYLSAYLPIYLSIYLPINRIDQSINQSIYLIQPNQNKTNLIQSNLNTSTII